ncbi:AraC family transcriptional regulator [Roseateles oligotrophus]|uniref:AraC family transcriptional regulator n=1 Tax=Roseateles oligotrophus TaxID=1769250 RepID=A0ABT2Y8H4_9BURK|nr:AraC family transcriptional regulator [Roseateles oligotrophus]MCV2366595.1 AraC family transcriptional regulator [Roseateles oligotrophus]
MKAERAALFWRDQTLPYLELRSFQGCEAIGYAKHSHQEFSIGAVTGGLSIYLHGEQQEQIGVGAVVLMNPGEVHACNPLPGEPWTYRMLYVGADWLGDLQRALNCADASGFRPIPFALSYDEPLYRGLLALCDVLEDGSVAAAQKGAAALAFFSGLVLQAAPLAVERSVERPAPSAKLLAAAAFIDEQFSRELSLDEIAACAGLSVSYLIRAFKQQFGLTPHVYQVNRRVQFCREQLRGGQRSIIDVAIEAGFADQAHLQRIFKRVVAVTPGQYRRGDTGRSDSHSM